MKKLDEIMELMTDEMADFKTSILHLQELSRKLQNHSIPITTEVMEKHLNTFFHKQEEKEALRTEILQEIDQKLKNAYILPKSLGRIFGSFLVILMILLGYSGYKLLRSEQKTSEIWQQFQKEYENQYAKYFSENPGSKEEFEAWLQQKTSR